MSQLKACILPLIYEPNYAEKLDKIDSALQQFEEYEVTCTKWNAKPVFTSEYIDKVTHLASNYEYNMLVFSMLKEPHLELDYEDFLDMFRYLLAQPYLTIVFIVFDEKNRGHPSQEYCETFESFIATEKRRYHNGFEFLWLCTNFQRFPQDVVALLIEKFLAGKASNENDVFPGSVQNKNPVRVKEPYDDSRRHDQIYRTDTRHLYLPSSGELSVLVANFDRTVDLHVVERFLREASENRQYKFKTYRYEASILQVNEMTETLKRHYHFAIFAAHAHESRLSINEPTAGIGYYTFYKTLQKITGDHVVIILGGDTSSKNEALSSWAFGKICTQFTHEYINGDKGLIISWNDEPNVRHYQSLFKFLRDDDPLIDKRFTAVKTSEQSNRHDSHVFPYQDSSFVKDMGSEHLAPPVRKHGSTRDAPMTSINKGNSNRKSYNEQKQKRQPSAYTRQSWQSLNLKDLSTLNLQELQELLINNEDQVLNKMKLHSGWCVLGASLVYDNKLTDYDTLKGSGTQGDDFFIPDEFTSKLAKNFIRRRTENHSGRNNPNKFWLIFLKYADEYRFTTLEEILK